jgi:hypothetical protein
MLAEVPSRMKFHTINAWKNITIAFSTCRYSPHCVQIVLSRTAAVLSNQKKTKCLAMMLEESLGAQLRTQCAIRYCLLAKVPSRMITSVLHNAWKNIAIPQCAAQADFHSCTGPTMLALKQRSHVNRSFHDACCDCWEWFCTKIALEFRLGSFNQISRLFHHNRAKTFAHWSNFFTQEEQTARFQKAHADLSLSLSVPLSCCKVSVPISQLSSTKSEYYKNVAI